MKHRKKDLSLRILSLFFAVTMVLSCGKDIVFTSATAAPKANQQNSQYLYFSEKTYDKEENIKRGKRESLTVVEGEGVGIEVNLPSTISLKRIEPFIIYDGDDEKIIVKDKIKISAIIPGDTQTTAIITPLSGSSFNNGQGEKQYTLRPNFDATKKVDGQLIVGTMGGTATIVQGGSLAINKLSSITLNVKTIDKSKNIITFDKISENDVKGAFAEFKNEQPLSSGIEFKGDFLQMDISINSMKLHIEINLGDQSISQGTAFTITMYPPIDNRLLITVVSQDTVLEDVYTGITHHSLDTNATDLSKKPYIELSDGDSLMNIRGESIKLMNWVYNSETKVEISWKWVPDQTVIAEHKQDKNKIETVLDILPNPTSKVSKILITPCSYDVTGMLVPTVKLKDKTYTPTPGDKKGVPIKIIGSGTPPRIEFVSTTTGNKGSNIKVDPITKTPLPLEQNQTSNMDIKTHPQYLDVYRGAEIPTYERGPKHPYKYEFNLYMGKGRGRAEAVIIKPIGFTEDTDNIQIIKNHEINNPITLTAEGYRIENENKEERKIPIEYIAKTDGKKPLKLQYIFLDANDKPIDQKYIKDHSIIIDDTKPKDIKQLKTLKIIAENFVNNNVTNEVYPQGELKIGFKPEEYFYPNIQVPYSMEKLKFIPTVNSLPNDYVNPVIEYKITDGDFIPYDTSDGTNNGIEVTLLEPGQKTEVTLRVYAENGTIADYIFDITRSIKSDDSTLEKLSIKDSNNEKLEFITKENFTPSDDEKRSIEIEVPFGTKELDFSLKTTNMFVKSIELYSADLKFNTIGSPIAKQDTDYYNQLMAKRVKIKHPLDSGEFGGTSDKNYFVIRVEAENGKKSEYRITIKRLPPDKNAFLSKLEVADIEDTVFPFFGDVKFDKEGYFYTVHIPYSLDALKLNFKTESIVAKNVHIELINKDGQVIPNTSQDITKNLMEEQSILVKCPKDDENFMGQFKATLVILPESGLEEDRKTYEIRFMRNDPDKENKLKSLKILDKNGKEIPQLSFNPETTEYGFTVDYGDTDILYIEPEALSPLATVRVQVGRDLPVTITKANKNEMMKLNPNESKIVAITVKPEDPKAPSKTYKLTIRRNTPSKECRLEWLKVDGGEGFSPKFNPNMVSYKVNIPEGKESITFTAKPIHPKATMSINKKNLVAEKASEPYKSFDAYTIVNIVVTAEDGKTQKTYKINVRNENLAPKSGNADLRSLVVNYGTMEPKFNPSITEYRVAVSDETTSVNIIPTPAVASSKITVYMNSKKLGDYYDNYSTALEDGENEITITVTSEDEKYKKVYTVLVYSKDEENQGHNKPITSEMVNFDAPNPIVVDITKYTRISADVFNKLKKEYPEKTIIFEGNDYSLRIKGSDITDSTIPYETVYDLGLSFKSPNEDKIYDFINRDNRNASVEPIIIHFMHHGTLPGPMLFTISLGRQYKDMKGTWYYYNEERDRMDLYGEVGTNSRGTFSAKLNHMSTYVLSKRYIVGSENKTNTTGIMGSGKPNPNTGYSESYTAPTEYMSFTKRKEEYIDEETDIE